MKVFRVAVLPLFALLGVACGTPTKDGPPTGVAATTMPAAAAAGRQLRQHVAPATPELHIADGVLLDAAKQPVQLHGINWFGFEVGATAPDGLWAVSDSTTQDFGTVVRRMHALGFNAVRLPFSFKDWDLPPINLARPCKMVSDKDLRAGLLRPGVASSRALPKFWSPAPAPAGICCRTLPQSSTFDRLVWVTQFFARNGMRVLLDNQLNKDTTALENPDRWLQGWVRLIKAVSADDWVARHVLVDILNEPDSFKMTWEAKDGRLGVGDYYLRAMDALSPLNRHLLFFIEGTGQGRLAMNWGDGLCTDRKIIAERQLSDPNPFFTALLKKPYRQRVVVAPHVYPPSISLVRDNHTGAALNQRLTQSFGSLSQKGYCAQGVCQKFPIVLGELGSDMRSSDLATLRDIALYARNSGGGQDGQHRAVQGWFWWAWNANSDDTKGLVAANWRDILWNKVDYLETLGLRPWYR